MLNISYDNLSIGDFILISWKLIDFFKKVKIDKFEALVVSKKKEKNNIIIKVIRKYKNCIVKQIIPLSSKNLITITFIKSKNTKLNKTNLI